jgi:hypothetical protein
MQYNDSLTRMVLTKHDRTIFQNGNFHVFSPASKSVGRWKAIVGKHNIGKTECVSPTCRYAVLSDVIVLSRW